MYIFFSSSIRMSGKDISFDDEQIKNSNFCKNKKLFNIHDIDLSKILVSKKEPKKTFIQILYRI